MKRILFLSMLFCCAFFCGQTAMAQSIVKKQCTPEQLAECAKVCDTKVMNASIGLTPRTVAVAQTLPATAVNCDIQSCDPADCPWICRILCGGATKAAMAKAETPSCNPAPACKSVKGKKTQLASIE